MRTLGASAVFALLALAVVAGVALDRAEERRVAIEVTGQAAGVANALADRVDALVDEARSHAGDVSAARTSSPGAAAGFTDVIVVDASERAAPGEQLAPVGDPLENAEIRAAIDLATDRAELITTAPIESATREVTAFVVPIYRGPDGTVGTRTTATGADRREVVEAWWIATVDVAQLAEQALATANREDLGLRVADGSAVLVDTGPHDFAAADLAVSATTPRVWTVTVGAAAAPGAPGSAVAVVVLGVAAAVLVGWLAWWSDRRGRRLATERDEARAQSALIADVAPVVQRSLDLADVLPTVALRLMDELGLAGVACSLVSAEGRQVDLFAIGAPVVTTTPVRMSFPTEVSPGETIALALQRGGRSVGVLRIRVDHALSDAQIGGLSTIADLATAAIINAQLFEQQQEAVNRLQEIDQLKTVFLGTASHELRTPVTAIVGFARLLTDGWDALEDEERLDHLQRIARNALALDRLVQDLLDFARLERGGLRTDRDRVDLSDVVGQAVRSIEPAHPDHSLVLDVEDDLLVVGDRGAIERILFNLVSNAAKYSPAGSVVRVGVRRADGAVEMMVDDQGPGVPEQERRRIFSRFFRGSGAEVVRTRGAGIGLSVVEEFSEQMGAEVSVRDAPQGGARFVVRFAPWTDSADTERVIDPTPAFGGRPVSEGAKDVDGGKTSVRGT